jgi:tripartite-type tricarboxylate transporter receptor subunit TctC
MRLTIAIIASLATATSYAQHPSKAIRFVVSAPSGSSLDVIARILGDRLRNGLAQPVVIDNRPAAGGTVAADIVAKSPPDGSTMVISFNAPLAFAPHL